MRKNYRELEDILLEGNLNDMYDEHHNQEDGDEIWKEGVDPDDSFYEEVDDLSCNSERRLPLQGT